MQAVKSFVGFIICLLLVGFSFGGDIEKFGSSVAVVDKASDCMQILFEAGSYIAVRIIPLIKDAAKCSGFKLQFPQSLETHYIMLMIYSFLHKLAENEKCMTEAIATGTAYLEPFVQRFKAMNCIALL